MLYSVADVISDAFTDLATIGQSTFEPPGDAIDFFQAQEDELLAALRPEKAESR